MDISDTETSIPIPQKYLRKYPELEAKLRSLQIGDSIIVNDEKRSPEVIRSRVLDYARFAGIKVAQRSAGHKGMRVWRIE